MAHKLDKPKGKVTMNPDVIYDRVRKMMEMRHNMSDEEIMRHIHVSISMGNRKTGDIPSVSLIPIEDCGNCKACKDMCYDVRNDCRQDLPSVMKSRAKNSRLAHHFRSIYFSEIGHWLSFYKVPAFRWHIGGDILDEDYLIRMIDIANAHKGTIFFAFTKMFTLVNKVYEDCGCEFPENMKIIFSAWPGQEMHNPHNFPTANLLFTEDFAKSMGYDCVTTAHEGAIWCPGDCTNCLVEKKGCMHMKPGDEVIFQAH